MSRHALALAVGSVATVRRPAQAETIAPRSPYLDSNEAIDYLRLKTRSALYTLMREQGLPYLRCGGRLRFDTRDLDAWLRGKTALDLHREASAARKAR